MRRRFAVAEGALYTGRSSFELSNRCHVRVGSSLLVNQAVNKHQLTKKLLACRLVLPPNESPPSNGSQKTSPAHTPTNSSLSNRVLPLHRQIKPFTAHRALSGPFQDPFRALVPQCPPGRGVRGVVCAGSARTVCAKTRL